MPNPTGGTPRPARRPTGQRGGSSLPQSGQGSSLPSRPGTSLPVNSPDSKKQRQAKKLLMDQNQLEALHNNLRVINLYVNSRHLEMLAPTPADTLWTSHACSISPVLTGRSGIAVYQVRKLMYNEEENSYEKLVSVYSALNSFGGIAAYILKSDGRTTSLYLATNTNGSSDLAGQLLAGNLRGQFPGCELRRLTDPEKNTLLDSCGVHGVRNPGRTVRSLSMIPSRREDEQKNNLAFSAQGYEKFLDAMTGHQYTLVVLSQKVAPDAMDSCVEGLQSLYSSLSPYGKESATYSENQSDSINYTISSNISNSTSQALSRSFGTAHTQSISQGHSSSLGRNFNFLFTNYSCNTGNSTGTSTSDGTNSGSGQTSTSSDSFGSGDSQATGTTTGTTHSLTMTRDNRAVQDLLSRIEAHLKRISTSQTFGMWNSACYLIADDIPTATIGTSTLAAIFSGDSQAAPRAYCNQWDGSCPAERDKVLAYIENLQHPVIELTMLQETTAADGSVSRSVYQREQITPAMMISGKEIPTLMGLPRKSVPGIVVDHMAEFGRNIPESWRRSVKRPISFGNVYHMGQKEPTKVCLDLDAFASHLFICGASGSGKSNTTYQLLQKLIENKVPFLVIEPAKGEYKIEFAGLPGINIFTADQSAFRPLRINPFEFCSGIHIREHLDNLTQAISACWPLYGAMPGILKQALEQVYLEHGWDLNHSERILERGSRFPVMEDLKQALNRIIEDSDYSGDTQSDYKGALLNRVSSLCNGFEGQIFSRSLGIPDRTLFAENTIIDLSSIGSSEARSLIMAVLLMKLKNYRKVTSSAPNSKLVHVTVLEEAHNLLKRCSHEKSQDSGNAQGAAVESLCRCISEMRSSGEGFMIIDQSPGAVDPTAIKNTAIKIVMRLPSSDDCQEMGAALSLNENQIRELSRLHIGVAALSHPNWTDTILAKMGDVWDGRYRVSGTTRQDPGSYTRAQGAIVQLLYHSLLENSLPDADDDVQELLALLCSGKSPILRLSPSSQKDLLESVRNFLSDQEPLILHGRLPNIKRAFFDFVFDFLQLDSVMKIFPLTGVEKKPVKVPLSPKDARHVLAWEKEVRQGISRYLYMPAEADPVRAYHWPAVPEQAEFFMEIYSGILSAYATRYLRDFRYQNAVAHLNHTGYFTGKGK